MRWVSNQESIRSGEPSVLAMIETLLASGISLWVAWRFDTVTHIAVAGLVAPLLLMRTELNTRFSVYVFCRTFNLKKYDKITKKYSWLGDFGELSGSDNIISWLFVFFIAYIIVMYYIIPLIFYYIKSKIYSVIRCFGKIPMLWTVYWNFILISMCIDMKKSPALFPYSKDIHFSKEFFRHRYKIYHIIYNEIKNNSNIFVKIIAVFLAFIAFSPIFIFALIYRLFLKSSILIWGPVLMVSHLWAGRRVVLVD